MRFSSDYELYQTISKNIIYYREQKGLTQVQLAEEAKISISYLSKIKAAGLNKSFSISVLNQIAKAAAPALRHKTAALNFHLSSCAPLPDAVLQPRAEHAAKVQQHILDHTAASRRKALDIFIHHRRQESQKQDIAGRRKILHAKRAEAAAQQKPQQRKLQKMRQLADMMLRIAHEVHIKMACQQLCQRRRPAAELCRLTQRQRRIVINRCKQQTRKKKP